MYRKQLAIFGTLLLITAFLLGFAVWHVTDQDRDAYHALVASSKPAADPLFSSSQQFREGVVKEIYASNFVRIESENSELFVSHGEGETEIVEELEGARCLIFDYPGNLVRYMEAKRTHYNYTTRQLHAHEVAVWQYRLEEDTVVTNRKDLEKLTAESAVISKEADYDGAVLVLKGDVQLENEKGQYALADRVTCHPESEELVLEGEQNRVLFFDKGRDMQLSAPVVHASQEVIRGVGNVRFIFAQDELTKLKERFQW